MILIMMIMMFIMMVIMIMMSMIMIMTMMIIIVDVYYCRCSDWQPGGPPGDGHLRDSERRDRSRHPRVALLRLRFAGHPHRLPSGHTMRLTEASITPLKACLLKHQIKH